jgi:PBSX family phage terminase large subunit
MLSDKQREYRREARKTWNIKIGATRSGKTYGDYYLIPKRLLDVRGMDGLNVILGNTKGTIQRNIIEPMQNIWGADMVTSIRSDNTATMFGERVHCLGADNIKHVDRLRGQSVKYCYGDEVVTWAQEVFAMLQSRLDKEYSIFDGACNPEGPQHWFKKKLDAGGPDWYVQHYTIDDNPFLPDKVKERMKRDFAGTVYWGRYILGEWTQAEGMIYPMYPDALVKPFAADWEEYAISCDYGTQNAFAALLWARSGEKWYLINEYRYSGRDTGYQKTDDDYVRDMETFVEKNIPEGKRTGLLTVIDPSAASFIAAIKRSRYRFRVLKADNDVLDGIRDTAVCLQRGTVRIFDTCKETIKELEGYVWDAKAEDKPVKENDHMMDAMRYFVKTKRLAKPVSRTTNALAAALMR